MKRCTITINRKSNNFDFLRLLLALIVAIFHCVELTRIDIYSNWGRFFSAEVAVDAFFVISGFLIFMSYESTPLFVNYVRKRIRRIFPGYITVVVLCSMILFFISTKSFNGYFTLDWFEYLFFNLITLNFIQPSLPGVFENHNVQAVNGALWTIKIEVMFYLVVPLIARLVASYNKTLILPSIYLLSLFYSFSMFYLYSRFDSNIFLVLERQLPGQLVFFISGTTK